MCFPFNIFVTCRSTCERFDVGRATALKAVRRVTKTIVKLAPIFIVWPEGDRAKEIMTEFAAISAFPKIIGAIDGTHINIKAPHVNPESYVNRKKHHSIHLQVIHVIISKFLKCVYVYVKVIVISYILLIGCL